ncbi:regulator of cell morphogenesis and NO signaling [alpha proteobacterium U9-1i]|nr:regulator of cell morphogenesis and NO signaling [alpha proteobacterium U9-1i]
MARKANGDTPNAIELLKADHRLVEELFEKYEAASGKAAKKKLAEQICMELSVHATIEEEILYPACKGEVEEEMLDEAHVEHDGAKMLIAELLAGSPDDDFYDAKVKVLSEEIKHHVKEEEMRDGLFAQAKKAGLDLDELGAQLAARKQELTKQFKRTGIPTPVTRSMNGAEVKIGQPFA